LPPALAGGMENKNHPGFSQNLTVELLAKAELDLIYDLKVMAIESKRFLFSYLKCY
jgi:hypothetical protein